MVDEPRGRDAKLPPIVGQKDFMIFLRFLDNRKQYIGYMKKLDDRIAEFEAASALYGKAKEIEKTHENAKLWERRAEYDYGEREKKLIADEEASVKSDKDRRAVLLDIETRATATRDKLAKELKAITASVDARETEVAKRENAIVARETRADKKLTEARETKKTADTMIARLQDATRQAQEVAAAGP